MSSERSALLHASETSSTLTEATGGDEAGQPENLSKTRGLLIIISFLVLVFILTSNISLLSTTQSPIAEELNAFASVSWFTSAYLIAITSITPVAGKLSQIFTARRYLFASIVLQAVGLLVTSSAAKLWLFLIGRAITGAGSAAVTPVALILVTELTDKRRKGLFFALVNTGYTIGVSLGAIIAGALEPVVGWRAVFWLQIPLTLSAATVALFAIPKNPALDKKQVDDSTMGQKLSRIDYFGVVTLISAVVFLLYSLAAPQILVTPIILSGFMLALFIFVEITWAQEPIVPLAVLKSSGNILTGLATIGVMSARWGVLFYSPVYAIAVRNWSQASAGLMLLPTNTGFAIGGLLVGWLHISRGGSFYISSLVAYVLFAISIFVISQISTTDSNIWAYFSVLFINGMITGALLNYTLVHVLYLTLSATHVIVLPLNAMFRSLSASFGSSISGGLFLRTLRQTLGDDYAKRGIEGKEQLINRLIGTPILVQRLTGIDREVAVDGYVTALKALFLGGGVLALVMALFQAGTGWKTPKEERDMDVLSNRDTLSPTISREAVAN